MKRYIVALVTICSSVLALSMGAPARAQVNQSVVGPVLAIGGGSTTFGIDSKFGISENLSLRPFIFFPSGGTTFGSGLTYDFNLASTNSKVQLTPFIGADLFVATGSGSTTTFAFTGGADFDVTDSIQLKAALVVPISSNNSSTLVTLGGGFKF
jgi:opacity protein-like surface antigen